jgi:hypothetical protein
VAACTYSTVLLSTIREECERERVSHSEALQRVTKLEAQLMRHEIELEEWYETTLKSPILPHILQQSIAQNEALRHKITGLIQMVHVCCLFHAD